MTDASEGSQENETQSPPHEKPVSLPFDNWKDALREFFRREDEGVRQARNADNGDDQNS